VREPFTTSQPPVQPNDGNRSWPRILSELNALRTAEGGSWYYAGITPVSYTSGIAGLGYVPGRTTLSWDRLPSAGEVLAHELGHNFGRLHAPCGGAGGADPAFPYPGGSIGNYGFDFATATIKAPTSADVMGYCNSTWISDYTYVAVMNHRLGSTFATTGRPAAATQPRRGLLVWGRIEHGRPVLEPAFEIDAPPALPTRPGPHRLRALGPLGETLTELAFDGEPVADAADSSARHFAFVVPLSLLNGRSLSRLVLTAGGASVERRAAFQGAIDGAEVSRNRSGRIRVEARNPLVQGVMIRSAATGRILAFGRDGVIDLASQVAEVEVTLSDGVQSTRFRTRVTGPAR
jgi:hypothetical protein